MVAFFVRFKTKQLVGRGSLGKLLVIYVIYGTHVDYYLMKFFVYHVDNYHGFLI